MLMITTLCLVSLIENVNISIMNVLRFGKRFLLVFTFRHYDEFHMKI